MGTVGGMGLLTFSAGASTVQGPVTKSMGFGPINEAGETAKLSSRTLGKIYD